MILTERAARSIAAQNAREERRQFFRDVFIVPWGWDPEFWTLDGILRGKTIPDLRLCRWRTLGWVRYIDRSPGYELTPKGEEVYRDELDEVTDGSGREDDWYDDDYDDDPY